MQSCVAGEARVNGWGAKQARCGADGAAGWAHGPPQHRHSRGFNQPEVRLWAALGSPVLSVRRPRRPQQSPWHPPITHES